MELENILCFFKDHAAEFVIAAFGSAAGAYYGAKAAQKIIEDGRGREELLKAISSTNIAITLSYNICNALLTSKKQFIKPLHDDYEREKVLLQNFNQSLALGTIPLGSQHNFTANLQTFPLPKIPVESLQKSIFENTSMTSALLSVFSILSLSADGLQMSVDNRNRLITLYKSRPHGSLTAAEYFGLASGSLVNEDYPTTLAAIVAQTDDAIFFSHLLCVELHEHGMSLSEKFQRLWGDGAPTITKIDWTRAEQNNLLPSHNPYSDWLAMFKKKDLPTSSCWNIKKWFCKHP
ncbi:hypothetical protein [Polynucleobacter sphagniphilus]|uniref:hypothetical protein n=1 Tax=Polynucleobacter sphagniphilus TaxID=1743169 RepID=UPI00247643EE|nr:hypothetical protein [Polynucleobacter sphagniphilus]MDH6300987.1 hypothetical protein [Polynucleobacter sphagniphilus]